MIGAGLAGLRCASVLAEQGRDIRVWEAADDVGGRIRTDVVDGFRCDRGFQVLNPAYPELERAIDVSALRLQPFGAGVAVRRTHDATVWVHPFRAPSRVPKMLARNRIRPADLLAVARWAGPALRPRTLKTTDGDDMALREALVRSGVSGELGRVINRFLAGVVLENDGATSNAFALLLARMFALGVPSLPAEGMQALPRQLADGLQHRIELRRRVVDIRRSENGWHVSDGDHTLCTRHVVVATDPVTATGLTGVTTPPMKGVVTDWWATDQEPAGPPMLWVDGRVDPPGPVLNTAVVSAVAPSYAPAGRHLIEASALLTPDGQPPQEQEMRRHAADILGVDMREWTRVTRHVVPCALPAQPPPLSVRRPVRVSDGLWLCGDHRDTASIQGALVSGRRTAEAVLRD